MAKHRSLAQDIFRAQLELDRTTDIVQKKTEDLLGLVFKRVGFCPSEESIGIDGADNTVHLSKDVQEEFYRLGFRRIYVNYKNGGAWYYYKGGDPIGYKYK